MSNNSRSIGRQTSKLSRQKRRTTHAFGSSLPRSTQTRETSRPTRHEINRPHSQPVRETRGGDGGSSGGGSGGSELGPLMTVEERLEAVLKRQKSTEVSPPSSPTLSSSSDEFARNPRRPVANRSWKSQLTATPRDASQHKKTFHDLRQSEMFLTEENSKLKKGLAKVRGENQKLKGDLTDNTSLIESLRQQLEELSSQNEELQNNLMTQTELYEQEKKQNELLTQKYEDCQQQNENMKNDRRDWREEKAKIGPKMKMFEARLESANIDPVTLEQFEDSNKENEEYEKQIQIRVEKCLARLKQKKSQIRTLRETLVAQRE